MNSPQTRCAVRHAGITLALASLVLLGCARKMQIEVPADFHGHVHIACGGLNADRPGTLRITGAGTMDGVTCPARQADVVVTRAGGGVPVDASIMWVTTGDGLVRGIDFDVR